MSKAVIGLAIVSVLAGCVPYTPHIQTVAEMNQERERQAKIAADERYLKEHPLTFNTEQQCKNAWEITEIAISLDSKIKTVTETRIETYVRYGYVFRTQVRAFKMPNNKGGCNIEINALMAMEDSSEHTRMPYKEREIVEYVHTKMK